MVDNVLDLNAPAPCATPVHNVSLSAFSMERFEVSYTQWRTVYDWAITHGYAFESAGRNGALQLGTNMQLSVCFNLGVSPARARGYPDWQPL